MGNKYYTPDGFNDQFPGICGFKRELESKLRNLFLLNGYDEIETPGVEYFDVYKEFVEEEELYKFTDSNGRLLCNRYDGTIPTVRFCAGRNDTLPARYSYIENMYRAGKQGGGKLSGFTQGGIELLGATGAKSDAEVLAIAIKSALEIGITDLQVSIGQVKFYKGLMRQLGIGEEEQLKIKNAIANRDTVTLEKLDDKATFTIGGKKFTTPLKVKGIYNAYNAAGALAIVKSVLPDSKAEDLISALANIESAFGRGEVFKIDDVEVELLLVKNPSAFQLSLTSFVDKDHDYMIAINDEIADGRDVSWLWNVDFSSLPSVKVVSGIRATDMALRLKYDEVKVGSVIENRKTAVEKFASSSKKPKRIFATYTAMLEIRKIISGKSLL